MSAKENALWQEVQTLRGKLDAKNKQVSNLRIQVREQSETVNEVRKAAEKIATPHVTMTVVPEWQYGVPDHTRPVLAKLANHAGYVVARIRSGVWVTDWNHDNVLEKTGTTIAGWMELPE